MKYYNIGNDSKNLEELICNYTYPRTICMQYLRILWVVLEKKIFKGLVNRKQIFAFFHFQSSAEMHVGGVSL